MPVVACPVCGEDDDLAGERAGVRTPSGIRLVHYCWSCQANDVTSTSPVEGPQPPPGRSRDLWALRTEDG